MHRIRPKKTHLFTPGPTPVPDAVLQAMSAPVIHHRTPEYAEAFATVLEGLRRVLDTEHDVVTFAASGTGAMESAVANLVRPGEEMVVAAFGRFGQRWAEIGRALGATAYLHETEWGTRPDPDEVGAFVAAHPDAVAVFTTHSETSTGTVSDAQALAASIRAQAGDDVVLVLDAISSLGAAELHADAWGWDVVVAGSQKALMTPPGLALASISPRALERARATAGEGRFYYDWPRNVDAHRKIPPSTAFTPALTLVLGLGAALEILFEEGLEEAWARHVRLGRATRAAVEALGFDLFGPDDDSSCVLTAVAVPEGIDGTRIPAALRSYGVTIAGGQAHLKGRIFRLGHTGWVSEFDQVLLIGALERALVDLGIAIEVGAGVAALQRSLIGAHDTAASSTTAGATA